MPAITIHFSESAVKDLEEIKRRYTEQDVPDVGDRLIVEIFDRVEALSIHPDIGRIVPEFNQLFLRELNHPPFRIVYHREPKQIWIVRIWRSERMLQLPIG
jgi:plasmid stabilization system protein ParE